MFIGKYFLLILGAYIPYSFILGPKQEGWIPNIYRIYTMNDTFCLIKMQAPYRS